MSAVSAEWPLVGRDGELRLLAGLLARADAAGVVLTGPVGVGKTRLASECIRLAGQAGLPVARVTATRAGTPITFGALAPLLPAFDEAPVYQAELLRRAAAALAQRAGEHRLALLVDNAHFLDDASATLVHQLAAMGSAFVVFTVPARQPAPQMVVALWKDGLVERLEVEALDGQSVEELLRRVLGGPLDPGVVARMAARAQGNLLFLRELVVGAVQSGALVDDAGVWRLVAAPAPSHRLVELVESRLASVHPDARALLEAAAVAEPLGAAELDALGDPKLAEDLESQGMLLARLDGRRLELRLGHPIYGEVLRAGISTLRRRMVARRLAEAVESVGARRSGDLLRVATWRLESGRPDPGQLLAAAGAALRAYDLALAERLARAAAGAGAGFPALLMAAQLSGLQGRELDAEAELAALAGRDDRERAELAVVRLDNLRYVGLYDDALRVAATAAGEVTAGPDRDEIEARRAGLLLDVEGPAAALAAAGPLLERADGGALAWTCLIAAFALTRAGGLSQAEEMTLKGRAAHVAVGSGLPWPVGVLELARADAIAAAGRLGEAEGLAEVEHRQALAGGRLNAQAYAAWQLSKVLVAQGRVETAARYAREGAALLRSLGRRTLLRDALIPLALAEALARRVGSAVEVLAEIDALGLPPSAWTAVDLLRARAWTEVAAGDLAAGRRRLDEATEAGDGLGDRLGMVWALYDLARLGRAKEVEERFGQAAAGVEGALVAAQAAHVTALARGDAANLEASSAAFEGLGALLLAAESATDAAVAWRKAGVPRSAAAAARVAAERAARCEGATTPALVAIEVRVVLTAAERETALLVAGGHSNRDIATDLGLSVRTVENRVQRVYEKLGISGRSELADALGA